MTHATIPPTLVRRRAGETARRDAWWVQPLVVFAIIPLKERVMDHAFDPIVKPVGLITKRVAGP